MEIDVSHEVGKLIERRKSFKDKPPIFERFNILVGLLREWRDATDLKHRLIVSRRINFTRRELADRGVNV